MKLNQDELPKLSAIILSTTLVLFLFGVLINMERQKELGEKREVGMDKRIFEYTSDSRYHNEHKKGDKCEILGFLWHEELGPLVMTLHLSGGYIVAVNPSCLQLVEEEK